jgi:hypothetical protein
VNGDYLGWAVFLPGGQGSGGQQSDLCKRTLPKLKGYLSLKVKSYCNCSLHTALHHAPHCTLPIPQVSHSMHSPIHMQV